MNNAGIGAAGSPFERYADDGLIHCKSQARARQVLAALEQRMRDVGLQLHPAKTRIIYCKGYRRPKPWDGPVSFDFLGYAFRSRDTIGKNGRFTGFDLAVGPKAVKRMNAVVSGWHLPDASLPSMIVMCRQADYCRPNAARGRKRSARRRGRAPNSAFYMRTAYGVCQSGCWRGQSRRSEWDHLARRVTSRYRQ